MSTPNDAKGKGRATETTPLLSNGASSGAAEQALVDPEQQLHAPPPIHVADRRSTLHRKLVNVFLISLTVVVITCVLVALLIYSYARRVRGVAPDELANAIIFRGPSSVDVLEVKDGGEVVMDVKGLLGVDTDQILRFKNDEDDEDSMFVHMWKEIGRWGVGVLGEVTVDVNEVVAYETKGDNRLGAGSPEVFTVKLTSHPGRRDDTKWLQPLTLRVTARPTQDSGLLQRFAQETWEKGVVDLRLAADRIRVQGGGLEGSNGWKSMLKQKQTNIEFPFRYKIPVLPGFPDPRPPLIKLLNLISYSLVPEDDHLAIYAYATVPSPLSSIKFRLPKIPYEVSLLAPPLAPLLISQGSVQPILTPPNISLPITGKIVPLAGEDSSTVLSTFLAQFLSGIPPPISIRSPLLPNLTIDTTFPTPNPPPRVLEDVEIKHMSISVTPSGGMLASGEVWATLALPPGISIPINVTHVWPDILLFDGPVEPEPEGGGGWDWDKDLPFHLPIPRLPMPTIRLPNPKLPKVELPDVPRPPISLPWNPVTTDGIHHADPPPLPDPVPDRAFGRIRPTDWVPATTLDWCEGGSSIVMVDGEEGWVLMENERHHRKHKKDEDCIRRFGDSAGWRARVMATVEKVPVHVLPGRDKQFRAFVSKVLWSKDGATAGMKGVASVKSLVTGLLDGGKGAPPALELNGLPFEGSVLVGKRSL